MVKAFFEVEIHDPRIIEENGKVIGDDTLEDMLLVILNEEEGKKELKKSTDLGFKEIVLTNSSPNRDKLVNLIAEKNSSRIQECKYITFQSTAAI